MGKTWAVAPLVLVLMAAIAERAHADPGSVTMTGDASGTITLPSASPIPFSTASFTVVATFDWSSDTLPAYVPLGSYPSTLSFMIGGDGPYVSVPAAADTVLYSNNSFNGNDAVEIDALPNNILEAFSTDTWQPTADTFTLSGVTFTSTDPPFNIQLAGGGTLEIDSFSDLGPTAVIFAPEPGTLGLFGLSLAATRVLRRRRRV
jgi:hypothetical protein